MRGRRDGQPVHGGIEPRRRAFLAQPCLAGALEDVIEGRASQWRTTLDGGIKIATRDFLVGAGYTIADIAVYGYTHRAGEAGLELEPYAGARAWLERVEAQPGFMEDVAPYGANAVPGAGRSIYELPITTWHDVKGSKVKGRDFLRALRDLWKIHRTYR